MKMIVGLVATTLVGFSALSPPPAKASTITLTMDEVPFQAIDGLTVTKGGESFTFSYKTPLPDENYHSGGPGQTTYVNDPSICCGDVAVPLGVAFSIPVVSIKFGIAENTFSPLTGAQVHLSDGSILSFDLSVTNPYAEAQFSWSGNPLTGFTVFAAPAGASVYAFDNLTVTTAETPLPATLPLFAAGLGALGLLRWLRKKKSPSGSIEIHRRGAASECR